MNYHLVTEKNLTAWMSWFTDELAELEDSRSTTFEIIGRPDSERYWQAMLAYFLDPTEPHGLGTTVLESFLKAIAPHTEMTASDLTTHLDTVRVETEVSTPPKGRADILLWARGEWFICIEMKVNASETGDQTERYVDAPSLGGLVKSRHEAQGGESQYVYLAPEHASSPKEDQFAEVSWRDIVPALESQLATNTDQRVIQNKAQLFDFLRTIKKHLTMGEFNTISEEARLYAENKSHIKRLEEEYSAELARLKDMMEDALQTEFQGDEWHTRQRDGGYTWVQLFKERWHNDAFRVEYEPQFKLGKSPPQIRLLFDIERGTKERRENIRDYLTDCLDESVVKDEGWEVTGKVKPCLVKTILLDIDSPRTSIEETVQIIRSFDEALGHHIDDAVATHIPE